MGRKPRIHFNGAIYHVWSRGVDRRVVFVDDVDRRAFLDALQRVCSDASAELLVYCLMGNHFHLGIKVADVPLATIMHRLLSGIARNFNRRHDRSGHLFQGRYEASICLSESYLARLIPYIVMNPVRAGLVSKPEDWPWSSLRGQPLTGNCEQELRDFDPWKNEVSLTAGLLRGQAADQRTFEEIGASISIQTGVEVDELRLDVRRRSVVVAKRLFAQAAVREGHRETAIAKWLNAANSSVSRYVREILETGKPGTKFG